MGKRRWGVGLALLMAAMSAMPAAAGSGTVAEAVANGSGTAAVEAVLGKGSGAAAVEAVLGKGSRAAAVETVPGNGQEPGADGSSAPATVVMGQEERIEQVYLNLPEVYVYGEGFTPEEVEAGEGYLSQDKLEFISARPFAATGEGIFYYVMLDISGSIPSSYFRSIKEGILALQDSLGEKDQLVLCTFGNEVSLVADGSQTSADMAGILEGLKNKDQETLLFEGIDRVATLTDQTRGTCRRQVLFVVSDGEDFATGKKQSQEALATLKDKGLPAYAVCIQGTAKENINSFGEFARTSGGLLRTFQPEEGSFVLTEIAEGLKDDICVQYRAASNVVSNKEENFSFQFADDSVLSKAVMNVHWIPDHEAPYLISAESVGDRQIRLTFSEPMRGLAGAANYKVLLEGQEVGVTGVAYDKEDETRITLTLADAVKNGIYEVTCANLTDYSMEKNPLEGSISVEITDVVEKETEKAGDEIDIDIHQAEGFDYTGILFLILVAVVALIILVIVLNDKNKKKKAQEGQAGLQGQGGVSQVSMTDSGFKGHVAISQVEKRTLNVVISTKGRQSRQTTWELGSSLIVGRASICDVSVEDLEMSRQHFCLEWENGSVYVTDLGSTNGTSVNGIKIASKRRIEPGDHIEAGAMKFTIRW